METMLATIEWGKLPWMGLTFALAYWKTAVAAVWGLGFTYLLVKRMKSWYKEDARDAAVGMKDEEAIFTNMKTIAKERRSGRAKQVLKQDLFWMPLLAFTGGKKIGKMLFYPLLVQLDKSQTEGIKEGMTAGSTKVGRKVKLPLSEAGVLVVGENASICNCGAVVGHDEAHRCSNVVEIKRSSAPKAEKFVDCSDCGKAVQMDTAHVCETKLEEQGMIKCTCGAVYKSDVDFDHVCPEETASAEKAECGDCERSYDPTVEVHAATRCACGEVHCKRHDCGYRG